MITPILLLIKSFFSPRFKPQAEQGDADAQVSLGYRYYLGKGVAKDYKIATFWFYKAAKQGNTDAESMLNRLYEADHCSTGVYTYIHWRSNYPLRMGGRRLRLTGN